VVDFTAILADDRCSSLVAPFTNFPSQIGARKTKLTFFPQAYASYKNFAPFVRLSGLPLVLQVPPTFETRINVRQRYCRWSVPAAKRLSALSLRAIMLDKELILIVVVISK